MPFPRASQALSRFTVLDLTRVRSGPTCVRQLADWGQFGSIEINSTGLDAPLRAIIIAMLFVIGIVAVATLPRHDDQEGRPFTIGVSSIGSADTIGG